MPPGGLTLTDEAPGAVCMSWYHEGALGNTPGDPPPGEPGSRGLPWGEETARYVKSLNTSIQYLPLNNLIVFLMQTCVSD